MTKKRKNHSFCIKIMLILLFCINKASHMSFKTFSWKNALSFVKHKKLKHLFLAYFFTNTGMVHYSIRYVTYNTDL